MILTSIFLITRQQYTVAIQKLCGMTYKDILLKIRKKNDCYICIVICIDSAVYKFDEDLLGKLLRTGKTYDRTLCYYGWNYAYDISSDSYMYCKSDKAC